MKCLIIAAGKGKRLSHIGELKPLLSLLGLRLIERTILTAHQAGVDEFYIVTGYKAEKIEQFLTRLKERKKLNIRFIRNDEWESKENGESVLKAKDHLKGDFILLMSDHLFEHATLHALIEGSRGKGRLVLAADFKVQGNRYIELDDVTKVEVGDGLIQDIGKKINPYNAFDTGMFYCTPDLFQAIEQSKQKGDTSLSGGGEDPGCKGESRRIRHRCAYLD